MKNLHNINETLFYRLVRDNLDEMLPVIYTPTVGEAVMHYSERFLSPRGLYIAYPDRYKMREILRNRTNADVDIIVVSDAEGVLGIGDQGCGGTVAKASHVSPGLVRTRPDPSLGHL